MTGDEPHGGPNTTAMAMHHGGLRGMIRMPNHFFTLWCTGKSSLENQSEELWDRELDRSLPVTKISGFRRIAPRWQSAIQVVNFLLIIAPSVCTFFFFKYLWNKSVGILAYFAVFALLLYWMPRVLGSLLCPPWPSQRNV
jgi:hypothetical protein